MVKMFPTIFDFRSEGDKDVSDYYRRLLRLLWTEMGDEHHEET